MTPRKQQVFTSVDRIAILGMIRGGKTTLCRLIQKAYPRVMIIDRLREYRPDAETLIFTDLRAFATWIEENWDQPRFRVVFQFQPGLEPELEKEIFSRLTHIAYSLTHLCLVIEEIWYFAKPNWTPRWLKEITLTGGHNHIAVIFTSQRPAETSSTLLSMCAHTFCGQLFGKNDISYLTAQFGEIAKELPKLPKYHFYHLGPGRAPTIVPNK